MAEPFLGEIRMTAFNFAPKGFALCNGQARPVAQNQALFALLGISYGGNGSSTFLLPNFQGKTSLSTGNGYSLGQSGGEASHILQVGEIPSHTHPAYGSTSAASAVSPANNLVATFGNFYGPASNLVQASADTISSVGSNQPHQNMQPYCTISFCIALQGIYPTRP